MKMDSIVVGMFEVNCFMVWEDPTQALVIDPGADEIQIGRVLKDNGISVGAYLLTHGHMDHICGLTPLFDIHPAPVYMHADDTSWAFTSQNQMLPYYSAPIKPDTEILSLTEDTPLSIGGLEISVLHTPGHSPGSVCFHIVDEQVLIAGDTLFKGSVGRTDLPGGSSRILAESLDKLKRLPDTTSVYCGHGPDTTIGHEKRVNYFLQSELI